MKKKEETVLEKNLKAKIKELEKRIRLLEQRPIYPVFPCCHQQPYNPPPTMPYNPPYNPLNPLNLSYNPPYNPLNLSYNEKY